MTSLMHSNRTDQRHFGVVEAIVVDNLDEDGEGRVKVQFPWFDENTTTEWCRVCQFYAGPNSNGAFFVPELQSEVLVAFVHGDLRQPIIVGSLYNGEDKPATSRKEKQDEKQLQTRSGHKITFVDTEDEERIVIVDKSGNHTIEIHTADQGINIRSTGGKLSLAADEIEIKAEKSLTIEAPTITEKASRSLTTEAGKIESSASGQMVLKGSTIDLN